MATTTIREYTTPADARLSRTRALGVAGAVLAAVAVWAVAVPLLGLHLMVRFGSAAPENVGIGLVVAASLIGSVFGWVLLAILERRTARARAIWTIVATSVLLVSLSLPLTSGTTASTKVVLATMHVAVAAVLLPALRGRSATRYSM
jgi:predicted permease